MGLRSERDSVSVRSIDKDLEKVDVIEDVNLNNKYANIGLSAEDTEFYESFPQVKYKKMIRKVSITLPELLSV